MEIYLTHLEQANENSIPLDNLGNCKLCQNNPHTHFLSDLTSTGGHQKLK